MMPIKDFCEIYNVSPQNVGVKKYNGSIAASLFKKVSKKLLEIDDAGIIKRKDLKTKIMHQNQMLYYYLNETMLDREISRLIANRYGINMNSFNGFIHRYLFIESMNNSILTYKISQSHWIMNKYYRYLLRQKRKENPKFTFEGE